MKNSSQIKEKLFALRVFYDKKKRNKERLQSVKQTKCTKYYSGIKTKVECATIFFFQIVSWELSKIMLSLNRKLVRYFHSRRKDYLV